MMNNPLITQLTGHQHPDNPFEGGVKTFQLPPPPESPQKKTSDGRESFTERTSPPKYNRQISCDTVDSSSSDIRRLQQQQLLQPQPLLNDLVPKQTESYSSKEDGSPEDYAFLTVELAEELVTKTKKRVERILDQSTFLKETQPRALERIPVFSFEHDLIRGELIDSGGFCSVYNVKVKEPERLRSHTATTAKGEKKEYVVKHLLPTLLDPVKELYAGAQDLALEMHFMAALDHPHILKLEGCSRGGIDNFLNTLQTDACFMILPKLKCTLPDKIEIWQAQLTSMKKKKKWSIFGGGKDPERKRQKNAQFCERLQIFIDLVTALEYLHERRIIHRDIKVANVGFDQEDRLQVFDFGFALELNESKRCQDGEHKNSSESVYKLAGGVGTPRYMAPELLFYEPYNCKIDVYSATLVGWETLTLERAFEESIASPFFRDCVAKYDERPEIPKKWPKALRKALKDGWAPEIKDRLTSRELRLALEEVLKDLRKT